MEAITAVGCGVVGVSIDISVVSVEENQTNALLSYTTQDTLWRLAWIEVIRDHPTSSVHGKRQRFKGDNVYNSCLIANETEKFLKPTT